MDAALARDLAAAEVALATPTPTNIAVDISLLGPYDTATIGGS